MKRTYEIPFKSLSEGEHAFDYRLDDEFFFQNENLEEYCVEEGLFVEVILLNRASEKKIKVKITGELKTFCDRCLDPLLLPFHTTGIFFVREPEEDEEAKDDTIFVETNDVYIELTQLFYEMIVVGLPQKKVHCREEDCNEDVVRRLGYLNEDKREVDPRWRELEKLI